jgi:hypothetical protein
MGLGTKTYWLTDRQSQCNFDFWLWVPRVSDPRKTTLARASSIYKRQTRRLVREGIPQRQDRGCQTVINIWSWAKMGLDNKTDWLTDRPSVAMWLWLGQPVSCKSAQLEVGSWALKRRRYTMCCSYSDIWSVWFRETVIVIYSYDL